MEICIAIVLIAIAALGLAAVWIFALRLTGQTSDTTVATQLARQCLEGMKNNVQSAPVAASSFDGSVAQPAVKGFPPFPYPAYQVDGNDYVLNVTSEPLQADLVRVKVDVFWRAGRKVGLQTLLYRP